MMKTQLLVFIYVAFSLNGLNQTHAQSSVDYGNPRFKECTGYFEAINYTGSASLSICKDLFDKNDFYFQDNRYHACFDHYVGANYTQSSSDSICAEQFRNNLFYVHQPWFKNCYQTYVEKNYTKSASTSICLDEYQSQVASLDKKKLSLEETKRIAQLPVDTQIVLPASLSIPTGNCGSPAGQPKVKCWICQGEGIANDILLVHPRTLLVQSSDLLNNGQEFRLQIQNDPTNIQSVRCLSDQPIEIKSRESLLDIFKQNQIQLLPARPEQF